MSTRLTVLSLLITIACAGHANSSTEPLSPVREAAAIARTQECPQGMPETVALLITGESAAPCAAMTGHTEGRNSPAVNHRASGKELLRVMVKYNGSGGLDPIESHVDHANGLFLKLVKKYGYWHAVERWNSPSN